MNDPSSTNSGLIKKIAILEQQIKELEQMEAAHKCVEEALRESEERYRTLVEYATDIVFRTDGTGRFTFVNPAAIRITGYEAKELIGKHYPTLIRQDMRDEAMKFFGRQFVKGIQNTYSEYCIITKDGHEVWLGQNTQLIVENGRVIGFQVVSRDVSAQKQTEEALRESEEKYRLVVENAAESIVIAQDGLLKYMNPMTLKLLGYSEAVLTSMPFVEFIHPEDREKLFEAHIRIMRGEENQPVHQFRVVTSDGTVRWAESRAVVISWEGKPATLNFLTDTTERKRAEELLRESENRYRELSIVDDLTQLYNSRYFYHQLKLEMDRSKRYEQPLTLLLLDLDNFKAFNDAYGHVEGDQVLLRLGQVVRRCLRQTDSAYRYGGEEFTILLPMTTGADGAVTAERIRTEFKKELFSPAPGQDVHVTVSIGLGQYKPQENMKAFVHRVDQLMYQGKHSGKDRIYSGS